MMSRMHFNDSYPCSQAFTPSQGSCTRNYFEICPVLTTCDVNHEQLHNRQLSPYRAIDAISWRCSADLSTHHASRIAPSITMRRIHIRCTRTTDATLLTALHRDDTSINAPPSAHVLRITSTLHQATLRTAYPSPRNVDAQASDSNHTRFAVM
jgi:hypothetical protein